jgi:superfamily II DNA or RNA helicase
MEIALRDYQKECLETVLSEFSAGTRRQLVSLPTGSGKTVVMAAIARHFNKKTLLLAHREELLTQAIEKFRLFWPDVSVGLCKAEDNEIHAQVVIGSVQSCSRPKRLEQLRALGFEVMMIDEAHHSVSDSYQSVINELGFGKGSNRLLLGVTATPKRADKVGLGETFEKIVYSRSIGTMIKAGYLSPVIGRKILTNFTLQKLKTSNGDFALDELAEAVNTADRNDFIVDKFIEYGKERKGVAFCVDVQHCHDLAEAFRRRGIAAESVWGDMSPDERKRVLDHLKSGKIQIATSCGVLTEGFDDPTINLVAMCRPTKSHTLYIQSVGRGLRIWPGKQNCLVLDFTDRGHNLDSTLNLSSTIPEALVFHEESQGEEEGGEAEEKDRTAKVEPCAEVDTEFDIVGQQRFLWVEIGDGEWSLQDDERVEIILSPCGDGYVAILHFPFGSSSEIVKEPLPLAYAQGCAEDYARRNLKVSYSDLKAPWISSQAPMTQSQRDFLSKNSISTKGMNKASAALEIRRIIAVRNKERRQKVNDPITDKQRYFLVARGVNVEGMTKIQAQSEIAKLKQKEVILC